jgi:drug/metabolite transporter (DMT)-like permease
VNNQHAASGGDPADALSRKGCLVLLIAGFLLTQVPRAVGGLVNGETADRFGAVLSLCFAAWLTWRVTLMFRDPRSASDRMYWIVSALGYAVFAGLFTAYYGWVLATREQESRDLAVMSLAMVVLLGLTAMSVLAGRRVGARSTD